MSNVVSLFQNAPVPKKRRSNELYDVDTFSGAGAQLTWEEAVEIYIRAKRSETSSDKTIKTELESLSCYRRVLAEQNIEASVVDVTIEVLRKNFVLYMAENKQYALTTINNRIKAIKRFFSFLHEEGWIAENPAVHLKTRSGHRPSIPSFTEAQVIALLAQPDQSTFTGYRDYTMLALMLDTGLRIGEMVSLKANQVDLKQCQLLRVIGKARKPRDVPFSDDVRKVLMKYVKSRGELAEQSFFVTIDGTSLHPRTFQESLKEYGEKAGIQDVRVSPHTMRHTFAKFYIMNAGDPYSLQDILGHSSQDMVKKYVNLWRPEMKIQHEKASPMRHLNRKGK
jgi:integrase/recombinase XerD